MRLHVGTPGLRGDVGRSARRFDYLELTAEHGRLPGPKKLAKIVESTPEAFEFTVVVPTALARLPQTLPQDSIAFVQSTASVVHARWIVVRTPADVRPGNATTERLGHLFEALASAERRLAWEPRGLWDAESAAKAARELGVTLVRDLGQTDGDGEPLVYTRLLALGGARRFSAGVAELVARRLSACSEAYVTVEAEGAARARRMIAEELGYLGVDVDGGHEGAEADVDEDEGDEEDE